MGLEVHAQIVSKSKRVGGKLVCGRCVCKAVRLLEAEGLLLWLVPAVSDPPHESKNNVEHVCWSKNAGFT